MVLNQKQIIYYKKWSKTRESKLKFILTRGILFWALPFTIGMAFFKLMDTRFNLSEDVLYSILIGLIIASVLGILLAAYTFKSRDKKYLELKEKSLV